MRGRHSRRKNLSFQIFALLLIVGVYMTTQMSDVLSYNEETEIRSVSLRKLLSESSVGNQSDSGNNETHCTEPSINEFPKDIFTQKQRRYGAILLHVFMAVYMFIALAFVCDDYFISSLDKICERLDLSEDVAGATFMAAGSSAPELFASVIGVFIAKGDVGVGTIVGSAVFNILVIISLCALFAGQVVKLTWWPLCRDSMYYMIAVGSLIWVLFDGYVTWYESLLMVFLYACYIIVMKFNPMVVKYIEKRKVRKETDQQNKYSDTTKMLQDDQVVVRYTESSSDSMDVVELSEKKYRMSFKELSMMVMMSKNFAPKTRFRSAGLILIHRGEHKMSEHNGYHQVKETGCDYRNGNAVDTRDQINVEEGKEETQVETPFLSPRGSVVRTIFWGMSLPLVVLLYFTIPDCRRARWEAWHLVTFIISVIWIGIFSYILVWMVCIIGYTLGIPDVIMGITFLAAGTSIPDAVSSLLVAREGLGDMAVSNSIGSNVFDILIGLAVPWFIKSGISHPGSMVKINSRGMIYSVCLLFASVLLTVSIIHCNKWQLDRKLGVIFLILYVMFVTISACIEFNLFAFVNFPTCVT